MKKVLVLSFVILSFFVANIDVFAVSNIGWANDFNIDVSAGYAYRNSQGVSSGPLAFNNVPNSTEPYADVHSYLSSNFNFAYGAVLGISGSFQKNYVYSITFYSCTTNFYLVNAEYNLILGEYDDVFNMKATYNPYRRTHASMNKQPFSWQSSSYNSCAKFNYLFTAQKNAPWVGLFFKNSSVNKNTYFDIYRIDVDIVGYDGNEIVNSLVGANETLKQDIIDNQNENTDKTLDADADSDFKGDNGSVNDYNQAEKDIMNSINVNIDDIDLDLNTYATPFSWIWSQVDRVINLNPKIFGLIITILTFGFIGLVIGR